MHRARHLLQSSLTRNRSSLFQKSSRAFSTPSIASCLANYPATKITTLPNGLRVATEPGVGETATVGVWIDVGSRMENAKNNGVAHFLEHIFFKGTPRRSRRQLEMEVENFGGHLNAYTARDHQVFHCQVGARHIPNAVDLLADMLLHSNITKASVESERDTILKETRSVDGMLDEVIFDRLHETAFRNQPLGRTILGSPENVLTLTQQDLLDFHASFFTASRMVVCGVGAVDHDHLVNLAQKHFGNVPTVDKNVKFIPATFTGSDLRVRYDAMPQAHVALAFPTAGNLDPDVYPIMVLQTMLGSWTSAWPGGEFSASSLISTIASERLCKSISTFNTPYRDTGLFGVHLITEEPDLLPRLMEVVMRELTAMSYYVDAKRLHEARNTVCMSMLAQMDGNTKIADEVGKQLLFLGRRVHPMEAVARLEAVDAAAVQQAARRFLHDRDFALAAIGPISSLPDYQWLRRRTTWKAAEKNEGGFQKARKSSFM